MKKYLFTIIGILLIPVASYAALAPNDTHYNEFQRAYFEQVRIPQAWETTTGSADVVIAVIDSGVDMDHPDLIGNIYFNRGEKPLNGIDDDGNGYVDDFHGWDFLQSSSDPHPKFTDGFSFSGATHGTAIAGVAASATNNNEGLAGVCWNCKIMPLRGLDSSGQGTTDVIARAIDYAVANGADIINMSFVGSGTDQVLSEAIRRAYEAGVVLVAAVGNDAAGTVRIGGDLDFRPLYPVCADGGVNHILGTGSVNANNKKSDFSNYGFACIDINAPGEDIAAPQVYDPARGGEFDGEYRTGWRGTSFAAPIVSGVAGLMKSVNNKLSNDQIVSIIRETAVNIDAQNFQYTNQLGAGLLDAAAAVRKAAEAVGLGITKSTSRANTGMRNLLVTSGRNHAVRVMTTDASGNASASFLAYPEFFRGGAAAVSGDVNGDGVREIITGAGPGGGPQVRIFNAQGVVLGQFFAYDSTFRGGVHVATGDTDGDGTDEIITSAGAGLSSEIRIFDMHGSQKSSFSVTAQGLSGGITVTAGDVDGDGALEIVTGTGGGSLPRVAIFDTVGNKKAEWFAYPEFFRGGVNVAIGDVDGDGAIEVVTAAGVGGGPQVRVFSADGSVETQFFAMESTFRGGATVAVGNVDADALDEIIIGAGPGRVGEVRVFSRNAGEFLQDTVFTVFESEYRGGVNVGI